MAESLEPLRQLKPGDLPAELRKLIGSLIPRARIEEWLLDREIFDGQSPLELLSVDYRFHPDALRQNVNVITGIFRGSMQSFVTADMSLVPTADMIYQEMVLCQDRVRANQTGCSSSGEVKELDRNLISPAT